MNNAKPFLETLQTQEYGQVLDRLTDAQHEVLQAVQRTQKKGRIQLTIDYAHEGNGQVSLVAQVTHKAPQSSAGKQFYYLTPDATLSLNNPQQQQLDLRVIPTEAPAELRRVAGE